MLDLIAIIQVLGWFNLHLEWQLYSHVALRLCETVLMQLDWPQFQHCYQFKACVNHLEGLKGFHLSHFS
jgi:hypothetical protein